MTELHEIDDKTGEFVDVTDLEFAVTLADDAEISLKSWVYLGGEAITMDGTLKSLTLPALTTIVEINAEDAKLYYTINSDTTSALSPGYVPSESGRIFGPLSVLTEVTLSGVAGDAAVAHIQYYREV